MASGPYRDPQSVKVLASCVASDQEEIMKEKNRHGNWFLHDMEVPDPRSIEHQTDQELETAYDRYFRRFADITGDIVLEQYVGDADSLPEHPIMSATVQFNGGLNGDDRAEAVYALARVLNALASEVQDRMRRSPETVKRRLAELARSGAERPPYHTLLGKALVALAMRDDLSEVGIGKDARLPKIGTQASRRRSASHNCATKGADINFNCDLVVDYSSDPKQAAAGIVSSVLLVYQREGRKYRYSEYRSTAEAVQILLQQHPPTQAEDLTGCLGDRAHRSTKLRYKGSIARALLNWIKQDGRFSFDPENSNVTPIQEAYVPHPTLGNGKLPLHPEFVYFDEWLGWGHWLGTT